jgi:glucose-1-phosphate thymidylyltransferase
LIESGKKTSGEIQLTDAMDFMLKEGERFRPFMVDGWFDCGERQTLLETNRLLLLKSEVAADYPGTVINAPVSISPESEIRDSTIGPYVSISGGARVIGSIVRDSIIGRNAVIENSELDFSVIGENVTVKGMKGRFDLGNPSGIDRYQAK